MSVVELQTRCGCSRLVETDTPPPYEIRVAAATRRIDFAHDGDPVIPGGIGYRLFVREWKQPKSSRPVDAVYVESDRPGESPRDTEERAAKWWRIVVDVAMNRGDKALADARSWRREARVTSRRYLGATCRRRRP